MMRILQALAAWGTVLAWCLAGGAGQADKRIDELIRCLGSEDYGARELATKELQSRADAAPALEKAAKSRDPEVARRAQDILGRLAKARRKVPYPQLENFAKRFEIDSIVDGITSELGEPEDERSWKVLLETAQALLDDEQKRYSAVRSKGQRKAIKIGTGDTPQNALAVLRLGRAVAAKRLTIRSFPAGGGMFLRTAELDCDDYISASDIACAGRAQISVLQRSVAFVNGAVHVSAVFGTLVVCDGDLNANSIANSVVFARGKVTVGTVSNSTIFSGEAVHIKREASCATLIAGGSVLRPRPDQIKDCVIKEKVVNALAPVTFFDTAHLGLVLGEDRGDIRVAKVMPESWAERAQLREGDAILEIQGVGMKSLDSCRRCLRNRRLWAEPINLRVRRSGVVMELKKTP